MEMWPVGPARFSLLEVVMWIYVACAVALWFVLGAPKFWAKGGAM